LTILGILMIFLGIGFALARKRLADNQLGQLRAVFAGLVAIALGGVMIVMQAKSQGEPTMVDRLNRSYAKSIPHWEEIAQHEVQSIPLRGSGDISKGERVFAFIGLCENDHFYTFIINYRGYYELPEGTVPSYTTHFAYIPDSTPDQCNPDDTRIYQYYPLGEDWYALQVSVKSFQQVIASTPTPTLEPTSSD
jgi:hypothetical protein